MGSSTKIQCKWCGQLQSPKRLQSEHGRWAMQCLNRRTRNSMRANELRWAGAFCTLLDRAGLTKTIACRSWFYQRNPKPGQPLWIRHDVVEFAQVAPAWAYQLAAALTRDHDLARKLGYVKRRSLVKSVDLTYVDRGRITTTKGKIWVTVDQAGRIPLDLRVRILRVAAGNAMARELFADDYEAAVLIIRDAL